MADMFKKIQTRIDNKQATVCVIGLGYVGLPLALLFAKKNYRVYGLDTNTSRIEKLVHGEQYIVDIHPREVLREIKRKTFTPTVDERVLADSDVIIVCVPTPLRNVKIPDISYIVKASKTIRKFLRPGQLIILESTSFPTTTREVVLPVLEKKGLVPERDFFLCFSPERVNPGDTSYPLERITKIVGGLSRSSTLLAKAIYSKIMHTVHAVSSPEVAESAKLLENTFRLVNIALVNEFAIVAEKLGISIWEIIEAAKTKPFGFMPFYPGPGVGGHCIPDDPVYLSWKAKRLGFKTKMIDLASSMNHFMPLYTVQRIESLLKRKGKALRSARVLVLGVTYKRDVKDLRESPALDIIEELLRRGVEVIFYDPLIPYLELEDIHLRRTNLQAGTLQKCDCVAVVTDHSGVPYAFIQKNAPVIFDTRNVYRKKYPNVVTL